MAKKTEPLSGWLVLFVSLMIISCKKDSDESIPSASLSETAKTVSEGDGTVSLTVSLSAAYSTDVTLTYSIGGTAVLNGDYETVTDSTITIAAGNKTATVEFNIFDDAVAESDKTIELTLSSSSDINFTNASSVITIQDNDETNKNEGLRADLTWDAGDIVNMNLYVANNVVISDNAISSYDLVNGSENEKGFESVLISNDADDGEYYIVVAYESGSRDVNYTITLNSSGIDNEQGSDSFSSSDEGYAIFWGPITKSGSDFARQTGNLFSTAGLHAVRYSGAIKK